MNKVGTGISIAVIFLLTGATLGGIAYLTNGFKDANINLNKPEQIELTPKYQTNIVNSEEDIVFGNIYSFDIADSMYEHKWSLYDAGNSIYLSLFHCDAFTINAQNDELICFESFYEYDENIDNDIYTFSLILYQVINPDQHDYGLTIKNTIFEITISSFDYFYENPSWEFWIGSNTNVDIVPVDFFNDGLIYEWTFFSETSYNQYIASK